MSAGWLSNVVMLPATFAPGLLVSNQPLAFHLWDLHPSNYGVGSHTTATGMGELCMKYVNWKIYSEKVFGMV
jgi:hypothetical protein